MPDRHQRLHQLDPESDEVLPARIPTGRSVGGWFREDQCQDIGVTAELRDLLRATFRWTDPGPDTDLLVSDRSGWWRDNRVLREIGPALADLFRDTAPTVVVSPEVTGFLVGPLVASALDVGFVEAYRDGARLPIAEPMAWVDVPSDHRGRPQRLGVRRSLLGADDRVLVVDDWAVTGAQSRALHAVALSLGATPVGTAVIVNECPGDPTIRGLLTGKDLA
jgi:adenine phosphoribosyltransferase